MTTLALTPDQVTLVQVLIVVVLIAGLVLSALLTAVGAGLRDHQIPDVAAIKAEPIPDECTLCGGAGRVDLADEDDRIIAFDVTCPRCCGAGVLELWS